MNTNDMKATLKQGKDYIKNMDRKLRRRILAGGGALLVVAVILALVLNHSSYSVLFSGLNQEEAQQIMGKLQESGIDYQYTNDSILVPEDMADQTRAELAYEGYPKSGFTYDTFINNAGLMTTDSDKKTYKLYELQDRIGATIRLFEGVKDAKVTIALGDSSEYALSDEETPSSAYVAVIMEDGGSPDEKQAEAFQRLVAKGVPGMELTDVAVFDGNGNDVSVVTDEEGNTANSSDAEAISSVVEKQIESKISSLLTPVYGAGNVRVAARAIVNMERLIRETVTYSTPDKIDEQDKTGIVSKESGSEEVSAEDGEAGGVAGSETNADVPEYNAANTTDENTNYSSQTYDREYLVNKITEQGQIDPGVLDDLTVSVIINGENLGDLSQNEIRDLVGNAAGIAAGERQEKISVANAVFFGTEVSANEKPTASKVTIRQIVIPAGSVLLLILIFVIAFALFRRKRRKSKEKDAMRAENEARLHVEPIINEEILGMQNDRGMELKQKVREFTESNPEISAQLLKNWLNGGGTKDGR